MGEHMNLKQAATKRHWPWSAFCAVWLLACIAACGVDRTSQFGSDERAVERAPVLVSLSGFGSCRKDELGSWTPRGSDVEVQARAVIRELDSYDKPWAWVRACFDRDGHYYYASQSSRDGQSQIVSTSQARDLRALTARVVAESERLHDGRVYLIGHSHGGWLAMQLILKLPKHVPVGVLTTIDPISVLNCRGGGELAWNSFGYGSGCQEAPSDITRGQRQYIIERLGGDTRHWAHYYQRQFTPLRSNAFVGEPQPGFSRDVSPFFAYGGAKSAFNAHAAIDNLGLIWYGFTRRILEDLGWWSPGQSKVININPQFIDWQARDTQD